MANWLKLDTNIMHDEKILIIRKYPDGDKLFVLWIGLLCLAMKRESEVLYIADDMPYTPDDIAAYLDLPINVVNMGLGLFERLGMICAVGDEIIVTKFADHQNLEAISRQRKQSRERMKRYRERLALPIPDVTRIVTRMQRKSYETELEKEEEREKEGDIVGRLPDVAPKPTKPKLPIAETTRQIIEYLNEKGGTKCNPEAQGNRAKVGRLLRKGYTIEDMKKVIVIKSLKWKDNGKMRDYLRPSTLFGPEKFDDYIAEYELERSDAAR